MKIFIPEVMLACSDEEKRAFAAAYWMGVCVGELITLGASEQEVRDGFDRAMRSALEMRNAGKS